MFAEITSFCLKKKKCKDFGSFSIQLSMSHELCNDLAGDSRLVALWLSLSILNFHDSDL